MRLTPSAQRTRLLDTGRRLGGWLLLLAVMGLGLVGCQAGSENEQEAVVALEELGVLVVENHNTGFASAVNVSVISDQAQVATALTEIAKLRRLQSLNVSSLELPPSALPQIGKMKSLIELNMSMTNLDDEGLAQLTGLKGLNTLYLADTKLTDRGMGALAQFKELKVVGLGALTIKEPLESLAKLRKLQWVDLSGMEVGDDILLSLEDVESLQTVSLEGSEYAQEILEQLKKNRRDIEFKL